MYKKKDRKGEKNPNTYAQRKNKPTKLKPKQTNQPKPQTKTKQQNTHKQPEARRNTIKETVASGATEGKHRKRGSLEAKDQLSRQKFFALRL